jgi:hypothetical protein
MEQNIKDHPSIFELLNILIISNLIDRWPPTPHLFTGCHGPQRNYIELKVSKHKGNQHNNEKPDTLLNEAWHYNKNVTLSIMAFSITIKMQHSA